MLKIHCLQSPESLATGMGQTVEKPQGLSGKTSPGESLKPRDFLKANPRAQPDGLPSENLEGFRLNYIILYNIIQYNYII